VTIAPRSYSACRQHFDDTHFDAILEKSEGENQTGGSGTNLMMEVLVSRNVIVVSTHYKNIGHGHV
jgi:hypothetical protein